MLEVAPALAGGIHDRRVLCVEGALRERGECAKLLDLVPEELDPERLATRRGKHVDEAAPHCELPALVDAVDPFVTREGEVLREPVDPRLVADAQAKRRGAGLQRRQPLAEGSCRRANEAAGREDVEGAVALPDEVRRRRESRAPPDAPAREKCDRAVTREPRGPLRRVARVGVLGQEDEERSSELGVQRGEEQRQDRLGHTRARGKRAHERLKAVVAPQLVDERCERCGLCNDLVHEDGRERARAAIVLAARRRPARSPGARPATAEGASTWVCYGRPTRPPRRAPTTLYGSCLCGGVRFEVTAPFLWANHCHCSRCRKHSGTFGGTQGRVPRDGRGSGRPARVPHVRRLPRALG
jgi:hypothetical protein